jgi:hypothetical protein
MGDKRTGDRRDIFRSSTFNIQPEQLTMRSLEDAVGGTGIEFCLALNRVFAVMQDGR